MSAVHLARKPAAARPASPEWTAAAAARATHINNIAGGGAGGLFAQLRAAGIAVEDPEVFADNVILDARTAEPTGGPAAARGQAPSRLPGRVTPNHRRSIRRRKAAAASSSRNFLLRKRTGV